MVCQRSTRRHEATASRSSQHRQSTRMALDTRPGAMSRPVHEPAQSVLESSSSCPRFSAILRRDPRKLHRTEPIEIEIILDHLNLGIVVLVRFRRRRGERINEFRLRHGRTPRDVAITCHLVEFALGQRREVTLHHGSYLSARSRRGPFGGMCASA